MENMSSGGWVGCRIAPPTWFLPGHRHPGAWGNISHTSPSWSDINVLWWTKDSTGYFRDLGQENLHPIQSWKLGACCSGEALSCILHRQQLERISLHANILSLGPGLGLPQCLSSPIEVSASFGCFTSSTGASPWLKNKVHGVGTHVVPSNRWLTPGTALCHLLNCFLSPSD